MPEKHAEKNYGGWIWVILVWGVIFVVIWLTSPDTKKMTDEEYMYYQMENYDGPQ